MWPVGLFFSFGTIVSVSAMLPEVFACSHLAKLFGTIAIAVSIYPSIATILIHAIF